MSIVEYGTGDTTSGVLCSHLEQGVSLDDPLLGNILGFKPTLQDLETPRGEFLFAEPGPSDNDYFAPGLQWGFLRTLRLKKLDAQTRDMLKTLSTCAVAQGDVGGKCVLPEHGGGYLVELQGEILAATRKRRPFAVVMRPGPDPNAEIKDPNDPKAAATPKPVELPVEEKDPNGPISTEFPEPVLVRPSLRPPAPGPKPVLAEKDDKGAAEKPRVSKAKARRLRRRNLAIRIANGTYKPKGPSPKKDKRAARKAVGLAGSEKLAVEDFLASEPAVVDLWSVGVECNPGPGLQAAVARQRSKPKPVAAPAKKAPVANKNAPKPKPIKSGAGAKKAWGKKKTPPPENRAVARKQGGKRNKRRAQQKVARQITAATTVPNRPTSSAKRRQRRKELGVKIKAGEYKPPVKKIPYALTPAEQEVFVKAFGNGYAFGDQAHDHALCAAFRYAAQVDMQKRIGNRMHDVFGSGRAPNPMKTVNMPILTAHDVMRKRPKAACHCDPLECTHGDGAYHFMVDSVYYLNPEYVAKLAGKSRGGVMYTLHHSFNRMFGSELCDTYRWWDDGTNLSVKVGRGENVHTYVHPNLAWLRENQWSVGGRTLSYEMITTYGPMELGVFIYGDNWKTKGVLPRSLVVQVDRTKHLLDFRPTMTRHWEALAYRSAERVVVDKTILTYLRRAGVFKHLDQVELRSLNARFTRMSSENHLYQQMEKDYPTEWYNHFLDCVQVILQDRDKEIETLRAVNNAQPTRVVEDKALFGMNAPHWKISPYYAVVATSVFAVALRALRAGAGMWAIRNPHAVNGNVDICIQTDYPKQELPPIRSGEVVPIGSSRLLNAVRVRHEMVGGEMCLRFPAPRLVRNIDCGCRAAADRKRGAVKIIGVKDRICVTFAGCSGNILYAVRMRYMRELPPMNHLAWERLETVFDVLLNVVEKKWLYYDADKWYRIWLAKLPLSKRTRMIRAKLDFEEDSKTQHDTSVCCKFEVNPWKEPFKPRAFFPCPDPHLVRSGPSNFFIKTRLARLMNGVATPFIFAPGNNNAQLGWRVQSALEARNLYGTDDLVATELDLSMCETTMRGPMLEVQRRMYRALGLSSAEVDYILPGGVVRCTSKKRLFSADIPESRFSGRSDTTPGNTAVFMGMLWCALALAGMGEDLYVAPIGGDDCLIYHRRKHRPAVEDAVAHLGNCGLKPEALYHDNATAGRFYSGRFIRLGMLDSDFCQLVHVPLIGKSLVKCLHCKYVGQRVEPWIREVSNGNKYAWEHVPVLKQVNVALRAKYSDARGKCRIDLPYREINSTYVVLQPIEETYADLATAYNITVEQIKDLEKYAEVFMAGDFFGQDMEHDVLQLMCDVDLL